MSPVQVGASAPSNLQTGDNGRHAASQSQAPPPAAARSEIAGACREDDRVLRGKREGGPPPGRPRARLVRGLPRLREEGEAVRDVSHAVALWRRVRWDTYRNAALNEVLAFYGLPY